MTRSRDELVGLDTGPLMPREGERRFDVVFLDRDGTLNVQRPGYVETPEQLDLIDGAPAAVARLGELAHRVVVVTNQRGVARALMSLDDLAAVHAALDAGLALAGARLDAYGVCPHEHDTCDCRKPLPGLLVNFFDRMPWADPARCLMIGDQDSDQAAAQAAGVPFRRVTAQDSVADVVEQFG